MVCGGDTSGRNSSILRNVFISFSYSVKCGDLRDLWRSSGHFCVQLQEVPEAVLHTPHYYRHL